MTLLGDRATMPVSCTCNLIRTFNLKLPILINPYLFIYLSKLWESPCNTSIKLCSFIIQSSCIHTNSFSLPIRNGELSYIRERTCLYLKRYIVYPLGIPCKYKFYYQDSYTFLFITCTKKVSKQNLTKPLDLFSWIHHSR